MGSLRTISSFLVAIAAVVFLALVPAASAGGPSGRLSYELMDMPLKESEASKYGDDEGAAMMLGMMMVGAIQQQVSLITVLNCLDTPEATEGLATYSKNLLNALMEKGFRREDAIQVVVKTGIPRIPSE